MDHVAADPEPSSSGPAPAAALLIRPDGYVAWAAAPGCPDTDGLRRALTTWFGAPIAAVTPATA